MIWCGFKILLNLGSNKTARIGEMKLVFFLMHMVAVVPIITTVAAADHQIAKPGCPDQCGGLKIPFPFGTRPGCFYNSSSQPDLYQINCDTSTGKPVPILARQTGSGKNRSVLTVNFDDHTLRVSDQVAYACYQGGKLQNNFTRSIYSFDAAPFASSAKNKLVAVGCDTTARVGDNDRTQAYFTGCMTSCLTASDVTDGVCSGIGCCEASIPAGIYMPYVNVDSFDNHRSVEKFNPCSFAFVSESGAYNFSQAVLSYTGPELPEIRASALLDWAIFNRGNCSGEKETGNQVLCGSNAHCVDVFLVFPAYRCTCSKGFSGNPYLPHGCQDIDECKDTSLNECEGPAKCVNKVGGYECEHFPVDPTTAPNRAIIFGLSISLASILALIFFAGLYKMLKRRKENKEREQNFNKNGGLLLKQQLSAGEGTVERTKIFSRSELEKATDNFNENRVLGRGGQGTVYKGMLEDGTIVAVKKSKKVDEDQLTQFINEVVILSQINHRHVVQLFGCCLETEVPMLVYEFVPNGTLYQHIHNPSEDFHITWKMRFQIAMECVGALAYLHSSSSSPIYHRDIKSSNILLDEKYKAKIADFGTSKTISIDQTHVTTCVQGTFGYLDPEFFQTSQFTEKSDVYSFGVVLLELLTSKKPISTDKSKESRSLASEFLQLMENDRDEVYHILDMGVLQDCPKEEYQAMANMTKRCLSLNGKQRPTMKEVAMTLEMIRSKHYHVANSPVEQNFEGKLGQMWNDEMNSVVDGNYFSTSSTSASLDSHSIDVQPLLFH